MLLLPMLFIILRVIIVVLIFLFWNRERKTPGIRVWRVEKHTTESNPNHRRTRGTSSSNQSHQVRKHLRVSLDSLGNKLEKLKRKHLKKLVKNLSNTNSWKQTKRWVNQQKAAPRPLNDHLTLNNQLALQKKTNDHFVRRKGQRKASKLVCFSE